MTSVISKLPEMDMENFLYKCVDPFHSSSLKVSDIHNISFEQYGNPDGKPVIILHGGPGSGSSPFRQRFFDPEYYHIVMADQRGCRNSIPKGEIKDNNTQALVSDINQLREHLGIDQWHIVFGGSWGSTLALAYCIAYPQCTKHIIMYGIFLGTKGEIDSGQEEKGNIIREFFPETWDAYVEPIPQEERGSLCEAYYRRLTGDNRAEAVACARAWTVWESTASHLMPASEHPLEGGSDDEHLQRARIECHYFVNNCFLEDDFILRNVDKIRHLKCTIVQGRYDIVCPPISAYKLHRKWPESVLHFIPDSGHSGKEPSTARKIVEISKECEEQ